jgi:hypothetical protein
VLVLVLEAIMVHTRVVDRQAIRVKLPLLPIANVQVHREHAEHLPPNNAAEQALPCATLRNGHCCAPPLELNSAEPPKRNCSALHCTGSAPL